METKAKCLIVDDEPLAIEVLKKHLEKLGSIDIAGVTYDAIDAFNFLNKNKVDLVFLDINMPEMKGTELLKSLKNPPPVIFTTAYREYAVESYDLNVLDYLLKPISFKRFMQAIEKFFNTHGKADEISFHKKGSGEEFLYMREKNVIHKIPVNEIIYAESMGDNLTVHSSDRSITSRFTISALEELLPADDFLRIHRSFIISLKHLTSFSPGSIYIGKKSFPIGPSYKEIVFEKLDYDGDWNDKGIIK